MVCPPNRSTIKEREQPLKQLVTDLSLDNAVLLMAMEKQGISKRKACRAVG